MNRLVIFIKNETLFDEGVNKVVLAPIYYYRVF
jgi:hypothetical protein